MSSAEIKNSIRKQLSGDFEKDKQFLSDKSDEFMKENNEDGISAVIDILAEIMPEEYQKSIMRIMYINGKRLDRVYNDILEIIKRKQFQEALPLAEELYSKITEGFTENDDSKFVSLRNTFEDNLYQIIFKPEKTLNRAPFDFARMISSYGYLLVEYRELEKAEEVLKKAVEYNPVDCGPKFELAEIYKLQKDSEKIISITKDTIKVASSPSAIARCYTNLGYMCVDLKEYDDAVVFYYVSMLFYPNPAVNAELRNIVMITGKKLVPPDKDRIDRTFEKYDIPYGPDKKVIEVSALLSQQSLTDNNIKDALIYLKILYGLTNDSQIKDIILKYEPDSKSGDTEKQAE